MCGQCSAVCPREAITISGYDTKPVPREETVRLNPDDVLHVIRFRRTVRQFQKKGIPEQVRDQILEAGRLTHTAKNMQDVSFVVLDRQKGRAEQMAVRLFRRIKPLADLVSPMARNIEIDDHFFLLSRASCNRHFCKGQDQWYSRGTEHGICRGGKRTGGTFQWLFYVCSQCFAEDKKALSVPGGKKAAATLVLGYPSVKYLRSAQREKLDVRYM